MVNEEILGGLKLALAKGESLEQAMNSFYNANYKKEEIEEAAIFLNSQPTQPVKQTTVSKIPQRQISPVKKVRPKKQRLRKQRPIRTKIKQRPARTTIKHRPLRRTIKQRPVRITKKVSDYGKEQKKPEGTGMTIILIFFLLMLLGILAAVFLFKTELIEFFNNLF
jgi:hypothetical protein